jgi:leucyl aminopeptidase
VHASAAVEGLPAEFDLLKLAGELVADALTDTPRSLGIIALGFTPADAERVARALLLAVGARAFKGPEFRKEAKPSVLKTVQLLGLPAPIDLARTLAEIEGANLVRWLTALPANKLSAAAYQRMLVELAERDGFEFRWLDEAALGRLQAGAFLAVAQGNATRDAAGIAHLRYRPGGKAAHPDLTLVGKGIIFDTGGTNTKSSAHMLDMHMDMSGSAVALAVLGALARLKSPLAVDCWLAITENRSGPTAYKQRDVVTASNGVTIEIIHTDAEGRMVLADTLALAGREHPRLMLDFATLTGACVHALSERYSGVLTNREQLHDLLIRVGKECGERVWPFPMDPDFDDDLKSRVADVAQCSMANEADQILAARFLSRFVPEDTPWIHMDLSAVTRKDGLAQMPGGFTGFGLRYALALLLDHEPELPKHREPKPAKARRPR